MQVGIIGLGVVGNAINFGFSKIGHQVKVHDIKLRTKITDVLNTEITYICVPTLSSVDGSCDTSIVKDVVKNLLSCGYQGAIAIKSTVEPGTTEFLIRKNLIHNICMVPEFLRERCAISDFTENHDICIVGTHNKLCFDLVQKSHGPYPQKIIKCLPTEAELCKYFNNLYKATLVTFANSFYEVCKAMGVDYSTIKSACTKREHISNRYIDCNEHFRGFGGPCLNKDTMAISALCRKMNLNVEFFNDITMIFDNI